MSLARVKELLHDFAVNANVINLEWDPTLSEKLLFDPFSKKVENLNRIAHYFLMVSSITESDLIGRAENARALMIHLNKVCIDTLYSETDPAVFQDILESYPFFEELGPERFNIPEVLVSVNEYVRDSGQGNFLEYVQKFSTPKEFIRP